MIATARKCLRLLGDDRRGRWLALVALGVLASLFEAFGAVLILVVLRMVQDPEGTLELPIIGDLQGRFTDVEPSTLLAWLCAATAVFFVVRSVVLMGQIYLQHRLAHNAGVRLAAQLLTGYLEEPYEQHTQRNSSVLIRNLSESVHAVINWTILPLVIIASEAVLVIGVVIVLAIAAPAATAMAAAFLGVQVLVLNRLLRARITAHGLTSQRMTAESLESLQRSLHGFREVRLFDRVGSFVGEFHTRRSQLARAHYLQGSLVIVPRYVIETLFILGLLTYLVVTTDEGGTSEETLSVLGLFAYAILRVLPSLNRILVNVGNLRYGDAALDDLLAERMRILAAAPTAAPADHVPTPLAQRMQTVGVTFQYAGSDVNVLSDVDVVVERGQYVGFVGSTGSGKSTLVDLLIGLLAPTSGQVLIDGVDLRTDPAGWQAAVGVVSQSVFLMDDTLRRNVAFGAATDPVLEEPLLEAIQMAQLEDFVQSLPDGLDTVVGERGVRLSGGQRQRVAIARALYRRPSVLFFDEGTSALDSLTEAEVMSALERLRGDRTIVAVAHRLSTVRRCDRIYILDGGRVTDHGTYAELEAKSEAFRRMAR